YMKEVFSNALSELNNKEEFVVASVVRTSGSTPQKPGSKLLVKKDGTTIGTLGGGCVEGDIWFASK
ncbi:MAG: XdhC family protein, partial [Chloroflexota bacterium]|nr:XdhC family protein [Chloroflexota bacterium]